MKNIQYLNKIKQDHHDINKSNKIFGLWIYLMSDCIIFAVLFSLYFVSYNINFINILQNKIFNIFFIFFETILLLFSSITYGYSVKNLDQKNKTTSIILIFITFIFGSIFVGMEIFEFIHLLNINIDPRKNAIISIFFTLLGIHGLHIIIGLIWILFLIFRILKEEKYFKNHKIDFICLGMFWHFLDIVWICIFSFIYLVGKVQ